MHGIICIKNFERKQTWSIINDSRNIIRIIIIHDEKIYEGKIRTKN